MRNGECVIANWVIGSIGLSSPVDSMWLLSPLIGACDRDFSLIVMGQER
jgi:hypothetical protein